MCIRVVIVKGKYVLHHGYCELKFKVFTTLWYKYSIGLNLEETSFLNISYLPGETIPTCSDKVLTLRTAWEKSSSLVDSFSRTSIRMSRPPWAKRTLRNSFRGLDVKEHTIFNIPLLIPKIGSYLHGSISPSFLHRFFSKRLF